MNNYNIDLENFEKSFNEIREGFKDKNLSDEYVIGVKTGMRIGITLLAKQIPGIENKYIEAALGKMTLLTDSLDEI